MKFYSFMAFLVLIVADMKCSCLSVCFTCLCNSTHRKLRCVGNLLVFDIRACRRNVCVRICTPRCCCFTLHGRAPGQSSTSGTECHAVLVGSQVQLQETVSSGTGSHGISCLSSLCWTIILAVVIWQQENETELGCPCRPIGGFFWNWTIHILHWTRCTVNWSVICFWYCRTAEDTSQRLHFDFYWLTYLVFSARYISGSITVVVYWQIHFSCISTRNCV